MTRENTPTFDSAKLKAKLASHIARLVRRHRLDYPTFEAVCKAVRKETGLRRPPRSGRRLPHLLPEETLRRFYEALDAAGNLQHQIMLRLLFCTVLRVSELANIRVEDVDLEASKIFIASGKGDKDRYILFPDSFRLTLKAYLAAHPGNQPLFESRHRRRYSTRRIEQIVKEYAAQAGTADHVVDVHPHLLRHQMLTWLTAQGLPDAAIQLVSGYASKKSLEVYQHLSLAQVQISYQEAARKLPV
jgi:site-specific recombinase XerD